MASTTVPPFGGRCALARAVTSTSGTATACPSPSDWKLSELARCTQNAQFVDNAMYHDREAPLNCWSRARAIGIVAD